MTTTTAHDPAARPPRRTMVPIGNGASLEVFIAGSPEGGGTILGAAHPAETFGEATAALLAQVSGASAAVCVNPRGLGASSPAPEGYAIADMADDLEAARRALGLRSWMFWGMSGGGWIGQHLAQRHPDGLAALIVESACACFRVRLADPACLLSPFHPAWRTTLEQRGLIAAGSHEAVGDMGDTTWTDVPGVGSVFRRRGGPALLVSPGPMGPEMSRAMPVLWAADARPLLSEVRAPVLVLCGDADPLLPVAHARAVHEAIPGSRLTVLAGAGHVPTSTGAPAAVAALRAFMGGLAGQ